MMRAMPTIQPAKKPPWWLLAPAPKSLRWLAYALPFYAISMLVGYPATAATPHARWRWTFLAVALVFSVVYGVYASRRIRSTVLASDEHGYTIRLELLPRRTASASRRHSNE
jgi:hypothetical protein